MNTKNFQKSITLELETLKNRVRDLIDDKHWLSDGEFKEAILRNVLKRNLPSNLSIGTGFVINSQTKEISSQIDLIIYENEYPPLFIEGDFILIESKGVKGIIEVKTKLNNNQIKDVLEKINENVRVIKGWNKNSKLKFTGLFSYDYEGFKIDEINDTELVEKEIEKAKNRLLNLSSNQTLEKSNGLVNHISLGKDFFIRYWDKNCLIDNKPTNDYNFYNFYHLPDLGYSYFISNIYELCSTVDLYDRQWFSFPIDGGKEKYRFHTHMLKKKTDYNSNWSNCK